MNRTVARYLRPEHRDLYSLRARWQADLKPPARQGPQEVQRAPLARPAEARGETPRPPTKVRTAFPRIFPFLYIRVHPVPAPCPAFRFYRFSTVSARAT